MGVTAESLAADTTFVANVGESIAAGCRKRKPGSCKEQSLRSSMSWSQRHLLRPRLFKKRLLTRRNHRLSQQPSPQPWLQRRLHLVAQLLSRKLFLGQPQ